MNGQRWFMSLLVLLGLAAGAGAASAQTATGSVTGTVTNEAGEPLPSVEVRVVGTRITMVTRQDGRYLLLNVPVGTHTITASSLGYSDAEQTGVAVTAGGTARADFQLNTAALSLDAIVATGVSERTTALNAPFTVGTISRENIATVPTTNSAVAAIQGKIAGASIVRGSGQPGAGVSVLLRTPTSIQGGNSPMFVVDGVILNNDIGGTTVDLESLDIESIEVVKGAAAASLYGSRAASGVIQITTRRGANLALDQTQISSRIELGTSEAPGALNLSRSHQFRQNAQGQWLDASGNVTSRTLRAVDADNIMDNPYLTPTFDNANTFFQPAQFMQGSVTLANRTTNTNFLLSATRYKEGGTLEENDGFTRDNFRLNLDHRLRDDFSVAISANHSMYDRDLLYGGVGDVFWDLLMTPVDVDLGRRDAQGRPLMQPDSTYAVINPIWYEYNRDYYSERSRTLANIEGRYNPLNWLTVVGNVGYDRSNEFTYAYTPKGTPTSLTNLEQESTGFLRKDNETGTQVNAALQANMTHNIGRLSSRTVARALIERQDVDFSRAEGSDFWVVDVPDLSVAATRTVSSSLQEVRSTGYFLEETLDFDTRYQITGLVRRDGSSLFGADERWHNYYRVGGFWRISEEPWFNMDALTELRLRASHGTAGGRPGFYAQYERWSVSSSGAVAKETLGNRDLKPEKTEETEMGVDIQLYDRYQLQLTYARQKTTDQIIQLALPAMYGYPTQWFNAGVQSGNTYEATLEAQLISRPNFNWSTTFVADRSDSNIDEWNRSCFFSGLQKICEDASLSDMWGERHLTDLEEIAARHPGAASEFQVNDDGYVVWVGSGATWRDGLAQNLWGTSGTVDGEVYQWGIPILNRDDAGFTLVEKIGTSRPSMQLGWLNNFFWRGFAIHAHLHTQFGGNTYNGTKQRLYQHERHGDLDQATKAPENKKTVEYYQALYNRNVNTRHFVEEGGFIKLRAVSVQYRLNQSQLNSIGIGRVAQGITLGLNARNLFTISDYDGFDPEVGTVLERWDSFDYPNPRQLTFTAEITF